MSTTYYKPVKTEAEKKDYRFKEAHIPGPWKDEGELWNADPNCEHYVVGAMGGGVRCLRCQGWFCY